MAHIKSAARLTQVMERYRRALNMSLTVDKSGNGYQLRLPGFKYDDFDRAGYVSVLDLQRYLDFVRFLDCGGLSMDRPPPAPALSPAPSSAPGGAGMPACTFNMVASQLSCAGTLYRRAAASLPMVVDCYKLRVGSSSYDVCQELYDERAWLAAQASSEAGGAQGGFESLPQRDRARGGYKTAVRHATGGPAPPLSAKEGDTDPLDHNLRRTDGFLGSRVIRMVNIDPVTRRPTPIPAAEREALGAGLEGPWGPLRGHSVLPLVDLPHGPPKGVESFCCTLRVRYADLDYRSHTNHGSFLIYAAEAAARAARAGVYRWGGGGGGGGAWGDLPDVCLRPVRRALSLHSAETFEGERLRVTTWQNPGDPSGGTLAFVVQRGGETVCRSCLEYHPVGLE